MTEATVTIHRAPTLKDISLQLKEVFRAAVDNIVTHNMLVREGLGDDDVKRIEGIDRYKLFAEKFSPYLEAAFSRLALKFAGGIDINDKPAVSLQFGFEMAYSNLLMIQGTLSALDKLDEMRIKLDEMGIKFEDEPALFLNTNAAVKFLNVLREQVIEANSANAEVVADKLPKLVNPQP